MLRDEIMWSKGLLVVFPIFQGGHVALGDPVQVDVLTAKELVVVAAQAENPSSIEVLPLLAQGSFDGILNRDLACEVEISLGVIDRVLRGMHDMIECLSRYHELPTLEPYQLAQMRGGCLGLIVRTVEPSRGLKQLRTIKEVDRGG